MTGHEPTIEGGAVPLQQPRMIDLRCHDKNCSDETGVYRMSGSCRNCSSGPFVGLFTARHSATGRTDECPACGCYDVRWVKLAGLDPETAL